MSITIYFYKHKETLLTLLKISHFKIIFLVLIFSIISFLCYVYVNFSTYRALGTRISYWQAFQVVAFSRLGYYIPGKVWYATNYYVFSRCLDIESDKIGKNFVINNAILFFTGALIQFICNFTFAFYSAKIFDYSAVCNDITYSSATT